MDETTKPVDRRTLYEEVWTDPVSAVAPRYGLSDVGLAKLCSKLSIPLPMRGYWAKVRAGKKMGRAALPALPTKTATRSPGPAQPAKAAHIEKPETARRETSVAARQEAVGNQDPAEPPVIANARARLSRERGRDDPQGLRLTDLSREELYELVWSTSRTRLAKQFSVSDVYVGKYCREQQIPMPQPGYWARTSHAKKVEPRAPLPTFDPFASNRRDRVNPDDLVESISPETARSLAPTRAERKNGPTQLHRVLDGVRGYLEAGRHGYRNATIDYVRPRKRAIADIRVSFEGIGGGLVAANALYGSLEKSGYRVGVIHTEGLGIQSQVLYDPTKKHEPPHDYDKWSGPDRPTVTVVNGIYFGLTLFEIEESVDAVYSNDGYVRLSESQKKRYANQYVAKRSFPTGRYGLIVYAPYSELEWSKTWLETRAGEMQSFASEVCAFLPKQVEHIQNLLVERDRLRSIRAREHEQAKARWERERIERIRNESYTKSIADLEERLKRWQHAQSVLAFLDACESSAQSEEPDVREQTLERVRKARELLSKDSARSLLKSWNTPDELFERRKDSTY